MSTASLLHSLFERKRWWVAPAVLCGCLLVGALAFAILWQPVARQANVRARASLADYGWDELSAIASELSTCESEDEALRLATHYGLCGKDGALDPTATKDVTLVDGSVVRVMIVGIWHDQRTDGGKAGLTFAFADAACTHAMNHAFEQRESDDADSHGGWAASDMRAWLNDELRYQLPPDLRARLVPVQKSTASFVESTDETDEPGHLIGSPSSGTTQTSDVLWLFSARELCGEIPALEDLGIEETMCATYETEGTQYQLFAQTDVLAFEPNEQLVRRLAQTKDSTPCTWWLRTKTLEFGDGFWLVGTDGTPLNGYGEDRRVVDDPEYAPDELWGPDHARGIVAGFCL